MEKNKRQEKTYARKRLNSIILLLAFAAIMLIVSTYAWFSTQKNVTISNLAGTVQIAEGLEISLDGEHFKQTLDLSQVDWTSYDASREYPVYLGNKNNIPEELQPVSTVGTVAAGMKDLTFYKGEYTSDGYTLNNLVACTPAVLNPNTNVGYIGTVTPGEGDDPATVTPLDSTEDTYPGYYAFDVFIKNTIQPRTVEVEDPDTHEISNVVDNQTELQLNYDSFVKILEKATGENNKISTINWDNDLNNTDIATYTDTYGTQNTMRVGFAVFDATSPVDGRGSSGTGENYQAAAVIANTVNANPSIRQVSIWEPNSAKHVEAIVTELSKHVLWDTESATGTAPNQYNAWGATDPVKTYAVTAAGATAAAKVESGTPNPGISQIYTWGAARTALLGTPADTYLAIQNTVKTTPYTYTTGEGNEATTVVDYNELNEGVVDLYDTSVDVTSEDYDDDKVALYIPTNAISRLRVYLWMEGQDVDCRNIASMGHGVQVNIDLTTGETAGTRGEVTSNVTEPQQDPVQP